MAGTAKLDGRKSPEARERARERAKAQWDDPERRRCHGKLTRQCMSEPSVREKIREGMARAAGSAFELSALRLARRACQYGRNS
jgi:hypothetical protein